MIHHKHFQYLRHRYLALSGDYALLATCSRVKMQRIHHFNVLSKKKSFRDIPAKDLKVIRKAAAKHGLDLAQMCENDNSSCS